MARTSSPRKIYQPYTDAPFVRSRVTTGDLMYLVILALLPCAGVGMYHYGFHAALLIGISVGTAIAAELVCNLIHRSGSSIYDYSCVVTGLIGGLILPPAVPLWVPAVQSLLAIVVFKHLFGGLGRNLFNPAMAGHFVLTVLFYDRMSDYGTSQYTDAAPLTMLSEGETPDLISMLTGNVAGCIGTSSAVAVLLAAVILLVVGIIDLYVPVSAAAAFMLLYAIFGRYGLSLYTQCVQLCGGSFLFTVVIMAGDYTTSPVSNKARVIYGLLLGSLIFLFRQIGFVEEACIASLLIVNAVRPLLDAKLAPHPFGANASRWIVREPRKRRKSVPEEDPGYIDVELPIGSSAEVLRAAAGEVMAGPELEMDSEPSSGEFESVVTDTSAIRPEAIEAALSAEESEGLQDAYTQTRSLPPLPTFGAPAPPRYPAAPGPTSQTDAAPGKAKDTESASDGMR